MNTYIMMTRLESGAGNTVDELERPGHEAVYRIAEECPSVIWLSNLVALGYYQHVGIFRARDIEAAFKVSALVRVAGHASTKIRPVME